MKTVMASSTKSLQQDSSSSKRHFHWTKKIGSDDDDHNLAGDEQPPPPTTLPKSSSSSRPPPPSSAEQQDDKKDHHHHIEYLHNNTTNTIEKQHNPPPPLGPTTTTTTTTHQNQPCSRKKLPQVAVARLRSVVLTALGRNRSSSSSSSSGLGPRVVGTLFGSRRGHVHFAFQKDPNSRPAFLIELATPISGLVKEMASGLVRIALECDKEKVNVKVNGNGNGNGGSSSSAGKRLLEENVWRTYCNGKKSGFATRRDCGPRDWKILKAVEPISMGAGVLPPDSGVDHHHDHHDHHGHHDHDDNGHEVMYMRAKFERIVGSRDSEAFYMMNPDSNGAPELSIYLLRV